MLFGYPIAATSNNWFHECVIEAVKKVHALADAKNPYPTWPAILPRAHRATLKSRTGLKERFEKYDVALRSLSSTGDRQAVLCAVTEQNRIPDLLANACDCNELRALPESIHAAIESLFDFAFGLLTELKIRDEHYKAIYAAIEHICPFCGTEYFEAPGAPREALDHYLAKTHYPFAAVNLKNLVPMGHKCNSSYKLAANILYDDQGARRVAFYPYNHAGTRVVLDDSEPFGGATENTPKWDIKFDPDSPAAQTWDDVFSIRKRYCESHLDPDYEGWLKHFQKWARTRQDRAYTDDDLVRALADYEELCSGIKDRAFLRAAVFRMLRYRCQQGHERLKDQLRDLLAPLKKIV